MIIQYCRIYILPGDTVPADVYTGDLPLPDNYEPLDLPGTTAVDVEIDVDYPPENFNGRQVIARGQDLRKSFSINGQAVSLSASASGSKVTALRRVACNETAVSARMIAGIRATLGGDLAARDFVLAMKTGESDLSDFSIVDLVRISRTVNAGR